MKNKKVVNVLLGVLALMLVVGMAYQFTPDVGSLFGNRQQGTPALKVNGQTVTVEELEALRRSNPVLGSAETGVLADDFKTFVVAQQARQLVLTQAASDIDVSRADVNAEVQKIRESRSLTDTKAWTDFLQSVGLTDSQARKQIGDGIAVDRKIEEIKKTAQPATDAEARLHYDLNPASFQTDARIVGRQIVVSDKAKAESLLAQVKGGADFAALARTNSSEFKDRGGALGPLENGAPRPVAQVALPEEVGAAAFALTGGGVTDVVESGGKFYIVKVERFLAPGVRPFEQAKAEAVTAVSEQKKNAAVERWLTGLEKDLKIEVLDPNWKTENPTVAVVAGQNIPYSDVVSQVVQNEQFAGLLGQVPPEQASQLVNGLLKPQVVTGLIQSYAAPTIAQREELALTGTRQDIVQGLAAYGARDVKVTDADIRAYYTENREQFETPAGGTVAEASFADQAKAQAFRQGWNGQGSFTTAATRAGGTVSERGQAAPGTPEAPGPLAPAVETAVFKGQNLRAAGEGSLSDVVKVGDRFVVAYVTDLKRAAVQPLAAVQGQIRQQVLTTKKQEAGQAYVAKQVEALKPVNNLQKVLDAQQKRVAAAAPPPAATPEAAQPKAGDGTGSTAADAPADAAQTPATTPPATTPDAGTGAEAGEGSAAPATPEGTSDR